MAFVYRSRKDLINPIEANKTQLNSIKLLNELYNLTNSPFKNAKTQPDVPFSSTAKRETKNLINVSISPGPAAYRLKNNLIKNKFNENDTSPFNDYKKKLFISQEKRFNEKIYQNGNPGPGNYYKDKIKPENPFPFLDDSHIIKFGNYELNNPNRAVTIPSTMDSIIVTQNKKGQYKISENKEKKNNEICNDNSNIGPGSYDVNISEKNNNIIDWSKSGNTKLKNSPKKNDELNDEIVGNFNPIQGKNVQNFRNYWNVNNDNLNYNYASKIEEKICQTGYYDFQEKIKKEKNKKNENKDATPGPGEYKIVNSIENNRKYSRYQNFGSNVSRGLLCNSQRHNNNIKIGKTRSSNFLLTESCNLSNSINENNNKSINKSINKSQSKDSNIKNNIIDKKQKLLKSPYQIKNKNSEEKKYELSNIGPGSYDPIIPSTIRKNNNNITQNFGSLEKKFNNNLYNTPGVGSYNFIDNWLPNKKYFKSGVPQNIIKRNSEGISANSLYDNRIKLYFDKHTAPCVGQYSPESNDSIEYKSKKLFIDSIIAKKPGFISGEKRFHEFKRKYEDQNQVGKYDIAGKEKKMGQKMIPFASSSERGEKILDDARYKVNIGPGSYRYDSFFDWNTKTRNILFA